MRVKPISLFSSELKVGIRPLLMRVSTFQSPAGVTPGFTSLMEASCTFAPLDMGCFSYK